MSFNSQLNLIFGIFQDKSAPRENACSRVGMNFAMVRVGRK